MNHRISSVVSPSTIHVHVDRLVLHGFKAEDRHRIGEAVQSELTRLLAEQGIPAALTKGNGMAGMDVGTFEWDPASRPEITGSQVARAIMEGIRK